VETGRPASAPSFSRASAAIDALFHVAVIGLVAALLVYGTVLPNARRAARAEAEAARAEADLDAIASDVERLRLEVRSLVSDPWYIERTLRQKAKALRPDLFMGPPLPPTATARPGP
jgi:hypothetical protein